MEYGSDAMRGNMQLIRNWFWGIAELFPRLTDDANGGEVMRAFHLNKFCLHWFIEAGGTGVWKHK